MIILCISCILTARCANTSKQKHQLSILKIALLHRQLVQVVCSVADTGQIVSKLEPLSFPQGEINVAWVGKLAKLLEGTSREGPLGVSDYARVEVVVEILDALSQRLEELPPLVQVGLD